MCSQRRTAILFAIAVLIPHFFQAYTYGQDARRPNKKADRRSVGEKSATGDADDSYDGIVERFIQYDIGALRGEAGQRALREFNKLESDDAIPALTRGLNRAARIQSSCPVIVIAHKLQSLVQKSNDPELLAEVMSGLNTRGPGLIYGNYLESMIANTDRRRSAITGEPPRASVSLKAGTPSQLRRLNKPLADWSLEDLGEVASVEKGPLLVQVLEEMTQRRGNEYTTAMVKAIHQVPAESRIIARGLLAQRLSRMTDKTIRSGLIHEDPEIRAASAAAIGYKRGNYYVELAALMRDKSPLVAKSAHATLVKLVGDDLGPAEGAAASEWFVASRKWEKRIKDSGLANSSVPVESDE